MYMKLLLVAVLGTAAVGAADAQTSVQERIVVAQGPQRQEGMVRVQNSVNFFVPGPTGEGEEAGKIRDRARRVICQMALRECDLLRETLARDCRLEAITVNLNRQFGQQAEGYMAMGNMTFQITLK
jgi:hypothetical protein